MTDQIDDTQEIEARNLKVALSKRKATEPCNGKCHLCGAPVHEKAQFCDKDCSDDWHQHRRMNGGW